MVEVILYPANIDITKNDGADIGGTGALHSKGTESQRPNPNSDISIAG